MITMYTTKLLKNGNLIETYEYKLESNWTDVIVDTVGSFLKDLVTANWGDIVKGADHTFGKIFTYEIQDAEWFDEIQIDFYAKTDSCGLVPESSTITPPKEAVNIEDWKNDDTYRSSYIIHTDSLNTGVYRFEGFAKEVRCYDNHSHINILDIKFTKE